MTPWLDAAFTRHYPGISVRGEFTWEDRPRRITALFGPSGCGKTTVLRCLAGLERPDEGYVRAFGEAWNDVPRGIQVSPQRRRIGFLFQDYLLFPHLTVRENIAFGIPAGQQRHVNVDQLLEHFQLNGLGTRYPRQLSGGQQQRVALARTLAAQPRWLFLDEPLSALDGPTRVELRLALRNWIHGAQLPAIIVSHDPVEVQALAEDVIVMCDGQMRQSGPVESVWRKPVDSKVARVIGYENLLPVTVAGTSSEQMTKVEHCGWRFRGQGQLQSSTSGVACIRAEHIRLAPAGTPVSEDFIPATVDQIIPEGALMRVALRLKSGTTLQALLARSGQNSAFGVGQEVMVTASPADVMIVPADKVRP